MKRARLPLFAALIVIMISVIVPIMAQVECPPPPPCPPDVICEPLACPMPPIIGGVFTNPEWLKVDYHRVDVAIDNQIARTTVDMRFVNEGDGLAEGTFVFPIPLGASVEALIMYINDMPIEARILEADEARGIYDEIVRQYRDPALLEYIGTQLVQANVFPIPPGEFRRINITYSQVLEVDNGLIQYAYPLDVTSLTSDRPVEEMSVRVQVDGQDRISTIYSPSYNIAVSRDGDDTRFVAGFEQNFFVPDQDFTLYYGLESDTISVNLLTYRESANQDGFFMLLVQPPVELDAAQIIPRDIILVLDQSGSMDGEKWTQARAAASFVLENLNEQDRFNVVLFSTGWRVYSTELEPASAWRDAANWVNQQFAEGGTDIDGALTTALEMVEERPATILFLTDGLPTEGETTIDNILANVESAAPENVRIFTFGVGDDVDTFLLDALVRDFRGASSYVRPSERVDEEVASLYNKISAPVLTDVQVQIDGITIDSLYPAQPLPDLFAGTQLTLVGRYRGAADDLSIQLSGSVSGQTETYTYDNIDFRANAGGDSFIARLWATRRIGDLLNTIRLNGENPELVDSIIDLSIRYGIITPYTSFLIEEDDILSQTARERAEQDFEATAMELAESSSGARAVDAADQFAAMQAANAPAPAATMSSSFGGDAAASGGGMLPYDSVIPSPPAQNPIQTVGDKTFILQGDTWTDTTFQPDSMTPQQVEFLSDAYFDLLTQIPALGEYFAIGERLIVVWEGVAYEVTAALTP